MKIQYQFTTDGPCFVNERPFDYPAPVGPVRDTWEEAASDAVKAGYARWDNDVLVLDEARGTRIKNIKTKDPT